MLLNTTICHVEIQFYYRKVNKEEYIMLAPVSNLVGPTSAEICLAILARHFNLPAVWKRAPPFCGARRECPCKYVAQQAGQHLPRRTPIRRKDNKYIILDRIICICACSSRRRKRSALLIRVCCCQSLSSHESLRRAHGQELAGEEGGLDKSGGGR